MDYNKLREELVNRARRYTHNLDDAEDLAHETFLYAWEKLGPAQDKERFRILCFTKMKSLYYDILRQRRIHKRALRLIEEQNESFIRSD